jgi:hypothetical protein
VQLVRSLLLANPVLALAVALAALALRLAVPPGFMPASDHGRYVLAPCPDQAPMAGMPHSGEGGAQARASCAFADLSIPAIGGAGSVLAAAPLAFAGIAASFLAAPPPQRPALRLRPPLRGPPLPR